MIDMYTYIEKENLKILKKGLTSYNINFPFVRQNELTFLIKDIYMYYKTQIMSDEMKSQRIYIL